MVRDELKNMIDEAVSRKGRDIHFSKNDDGVTIRTRRGNTMVELKTIKTSEYEQLLAYVRFNSNLDLAHPMQPQSGSFTIEDSKTKSDCRVSILPAMGFNSLVIRVINHGNRVTLDVLPYFKENAQKLKELAKNPSGLIMLGGPTESGKTTTAYAMIEHLKKELGKSVIIIDEPSEYRQPDITQFKMNEPENSDKNSSITDKSNVVSSQETSLSTGETGMKYDIGIKEILRHDPDVILIGEIRDANTARQAIRAALTGHLVISTIHSKDNLGTMYRMLDLGIAINELEQTAVGFVNQRLIPIEADNKTGKTALMEIADGDGLETMLKQVKTGYIDHLPYQTLDEEFLNWQSDLDKEVAQNSQPVDDWVEVVSADDVTIDTKIKSRNINNGLELD